MKAVTITTLLCCSFCSLFGQKDPMKFGEIAMEEMLLNKYDKDSSATAIVLMILGKRMRVGSYYLNVICE